MDRSGLHPAGLVDTHPRVLEWVALVEAAIRTKLSGPVSAVLWPYRLGSQEFLACDIGDGQGNDYSITFNVGLPLACYVDPNGCDPEAPDMAEALHMAALVLQAVNASVTVGRLSQRSTSAV